LAAAVGVAAPAPSPARLRRALHPPRTVFWATLSPPRRPQRTSARSPAD
jgi:hypothetical protein